MNALKHQHTHPATQTHPAIFKDAFGGAKIVHVNGVNVIGLTVQGPSVPAPIAVKSPLACGNQIQSGMTAVMSFHE